MHLGATQILVRGVCDPILFSTLIIYYYIYINIPNLRIRDRCFELVTTLVSAQMPTKKHKDKRKSGPSSQTSISPASTDAEEASADARDDEALSDYERREADSDSHTDTVAQLRANIAMLESRVQTSHLESRGAPASRLTAWKHHSLRPLPADTPFSTAAVAPLKALIVDGSVEFAESAALKAFCRQHHIAMVVSAAYTHRPPTATPRRSRP